MEKVDRKRKKQIKFRTTPEEKVQLLKNMEAAGHSTLASYLLRMGLNGYVVNINFSEMKSTLSELGAVRSELNKIGNNINQVAKHVNQSHEIDVMDFYLLEEEMKSMRKQIKSEKALESSVKYILNAQKTEEQILSSGYHIGNLNYADVEKGYTRLGSVAKSRKRKLNLPLFGVFCIKPVQLPCPLL